MIIILFGVIVVGGIAMGIKILGENEIQIGNEIDSTPVQITIPVLSLIHISEPTRPY